MASGRNHGSHFENHKAAFEKGAADDDAMFDDELSSPNEKSGEDSSRSESEVRENPSAGV